jgi:DNA-binding MarR family transcriptional regulator
MRQRSHDLDDAGASSLASELRSVIGKLKRRLREQANLGDLTWSQLLVLKRLERDSPATVSTLGRAEGMRPQSMSANVSALEAAGLVSGAPDPNDGRQTILCVTPACQEAIAAAQAAREDWLLGVIREHLAPPRARTTRERSGAAQGRMFEDLARQHRDPQTAASRR